MEHKRVMACILASIAPALHGTNLAQFDPTCDTHAITTRPQTNSLEACMRAIEGTLEDTHPRRAAAIISWLGRERPEVLTALRNATTSQEQALLVYQHALAYEKQQCRNLSRWKTILGVCSGTATAGILALMGVVIKLSLSC